MVHFFSDYPIAVEHFFSSIPSVNVAKCSYCGACSAYCAEKALQFNRFVPSVTVIVSLCCGCGKCSHYCSRKGIKMKEIHSGTIRHANIGKHSFISGSLAGLDVPGIPLICELKKRLNPQASVICDFGPGTDALIERGLEGMDIGVIIVIPGAEWEANLNTMLNMVHSKNLAAAVLMNKISADNQFVDMVSSFCTLNAIPLLGIVNFTKNIEDEPFSLTPAVKKEESEFPGIWDRIIEMSVITKITNRKNIII